MYWPSLLTVFAGLAAAVPTAPVAPPSKVKIHDVSLIGSGCPNEKSAKVLVDATGTLFEASFSNYIIESGPGKGASDWRKNCRLSINLEFDAGYQYASPYIMLPSTTNTTKILHHRDQHDGLRRDPQKRQGIL
jgi:uncharacterized protein DUF4360